MRFSNRKLNAVVTELSRAFVIGSRWGYVDEEQVLTRWSTWIIFTINLSRICVILIVSMLYIGKFLSNQFRYGYGSVLKASSLYGHLCQYDGCVGSLNKMRCKRM